MKSSKLTNAEDCYNELQQISRGNDEEEREETGFSGNSWLSNAAIITSIPDNKLKQQITYYKQMVHFLEEELRLRSIGCRIYQPYIDCNFRNSETICRKSQTGVILRMLRPRLQSIRKRHGDLAYKIIEDSWRKILEIYFEEKEI